MNLHSVRRQTLDALCAVSRRKAILFNGRFVGIGNRLKAIASFHRLHGLTDTHIYWCLDEWVDQSLTSVLDLRALGRVFEHCLKPVRLLPAFYAYPEIPHADTRGPWRLAVDDDLPASFDHTENGTTYPMIDFGFHSIPPQYILSYLDFFRHIRPSPLVDARMRDVTLDGDDIGVHVRIPANPKDRSLVSPLDHFIDAMRAAPGRGRFFVSAHSVDVSSALKRIFPGRILELPTKQYDSLIDSTADLFMLSKAHSLIASSGSTFSEVAWWLGGAQQPVTCV